MGKLRPSNYFLYKHRFVIGYFLLAITFLSLLFFLPLITPNGLSNTEINSAIHSHKLTYHTVLNGNFIDLPYHLLQKIALKIFGFTPYAIKLPSILLGGILCFLFILLLNRWFKNNTAIIASIITVLSSSFLFISGNGTPLIMTVFWPTLLLWLGSKIQGSKNLSLAWYFLFIFSVLLASLTPYMIYLIFFIFLFSLLHPHLRFTVKNLPHSLLIIILLLVLTGFSYIGFSLTKHPDTLQALLFSQDFSPQKYLENLRLAFLPFLAWNSIIESFFLAPQISLPSFAIAMIGLFSTFKGFFASRNSIALSLIIFTVIISGFRTDFAILLILPLSILIAHGLRYIINKWYDLFPENPYARIFGILPISLFLFLMISSDLSHFITGYRYIPPVSNQFTKDLTILRQNLNNQSKIFVKSHTTQHELLLAIKENRPLLGKSLDFEIITKDPNVLPSSTLFYTLGKLEKTENLVLKKIITSEKAQNADRLYLYQVE